MAHGRRVERVASMIRREMSELLVNGVRDERVNQGMVSITNVVVAGDLQHCKVSVSIFGSESEQDQAMAGLRSAAPYLRGELSRRLNMRRTPELVSITTKAWPRGGSGGAAEQARAGTTGTRPGARRQRGDVSCAANWPSCWYSGPVATPSISSAVTRAGNSATTNCSVG